VAGDWGILKFRPFSCDTVTPTSADLGDQRTLDTGDPSTVEEGNTLLVAVTAAQGLANEQMYVGKLG